MAYEHIVLSKEGKIAVITLNRPEKLNAYNGKMTEEFTGAIRDIDTDDNIRAAIITGVGRGFCSGHDLEEARERMARRRASREIDTRADGYLPQIVRQTDKPVLAAINGVTAAGGLALALACDIRIASEDAIFIENHVSAVGNIPAFETWYLPRIVGIEQALRMMFTGERVNAEKAERIGLVGEVVPAARLLERARELANRIAEAPLLALRLSKKVLYQGLESSLEAHMGRVALSRTICDQAGVSFRSKE